MDKHSPLPWRIAPDEPLIVETMDGSEIADCSMLNASMPKAEDAAFIVRAVNAHKELLREIKSMLFYIDTFSEESKKNFRAGGNGEAIESIIAKAEGE